MLKVWKKPHIDLLDCTEASRNISKTHKCFLWAWLWSRFLGLLLIKRTTSAFYNIGMCNYHQLKMHWVYRLKPQEGTSPSITLVITTTIILGVQSYALGWHFSKHYSINLWNSHSTYKILAVRNLTLKCIASRRLYIWLLRQKIVFINNFYLFINNSYLFVSICINQIIFALLGR